MQLSHYQIDPKMVRWSEDGIYLIESRFAVNNINPIGLFGVVYLDYFH